LGSSIVCRWGSAREVRRLHLTHPPPSFSVKMPAESLQGDVNMAPPPRTDSTGSLEEDVLDMPLSAAVKSFELSSDSGSDSDSNEGTENALRGAPTPNRVRSTLTAEEKKIKKDKKRKKEKKQRKKTKLINKTVKPKSAKDGVAPSANKAALRQKVMTEVAKYIEENEDKWTLSIMREALCDQHGWENNNEFTANVKIALDSLGMSSGGNRLKAE